MDYCKLGKKTAWLIVLLLITLTFVFVNCKDPLDTSTDPDDPVVENTIDYTISGAVTPGNTFHEYSGSFTITNNGNTSGGETVSWKVYRSDNNVYDAGDTLLDQGAIAALASGSVSSSINYSGTYPFVSGSNDSYFIIQVTAADDTDNTNNESVSAPVSFTVLFYETFENANDNVWTLINNTFYTLSFDLLSGLTGGTLAEGSTYALQQTSAADISDFWDDVQRFLFSSDITPSYIRFYIRAGQPDKDGGHFALLGPNPWPSKISLYFRTGGFIDANGSVSLTYTADTWYKIELRDFDYTANTYDVYINDNLELDDKLVSGGISAFGGVSLYNDDAGQFFYDDILIY